MVYEIILTAKKELNIAMGKKIYLLLTRTGTKFSTIIHRVTKYEYTHASIALDKELNQLYSFGRKKYDTSIYSWICKRRC